MIATHRLAAILAADLVGYPWLMAEGVPMQNFGTSPPPLGETQKHLNRLGRSSVYKTDKSHQKVGALVFETRLRLVAQRQLSPHCRRSGVASGGGTTAGNQKAAVT